MKTGKTWHRHEWQKTWSIYDVLTLCMLMLLLEVNAEWNWHSWFNVYYVRVRRLHSSYKLKYIVWINVTVRCGHRGIEGPALVIPLRLRLHVRINTLRRCILRTVWMHFTQNWWRTYRPQAARITVVTATPQITGNWWILNPPPLQNWKTWIDY